MNPFMQKTLEAVQAQQKAGKYKSCPRCGEVFPEGTSQRDLCLSRRAKVMICECCGAVEAVEDAGIVHKSSFESWYIFQKKGRKA